MVGAEHFLPDCQGALEMAPRPQKVALRLKLASQIVQARGRIEMLRAGHFRPDCQSAFQKLLCADKVPLILCKDGEVIEAPLGITAHLTLAARRDGALRA